MVRSGPSPNIRREMRTLFEQSADSLELYEYLMSRRVAKSNDSASGSGEGTAAFKRELRRILSSMSGPYLDLETRLELICLLNRVPPKDEPEFINTLLKLVALQLEPDLRAGELDVDRRVYLIPLLKRRNLNRPVRDQLIAAQQTTPESPREDVRLVNEGKVLKVRQA